MNEFELIERFFAHGAAGDAGVVAGVGDDAAIVEHRGGLLAIASDTMVAGVHVPADVEPERFGYRLAAVNLSDLAAVGATPRWATLALTVPEAAATWLGRFADGLREGLGDCVLVGGDTTRGPLTATLQLVGEAGPRYLPRGGATVGDVVVVSGTLGDARAGLETLASASDDATVTFLRERYYRPTPRLALGRALATCANAAIDVSDGLLADLAHVAHASNVRIEIEAHALPLSPALLQHTDRDTAIAWAASGGDDYELVCTLPASQLAHARQLAHAQGVDVSVIGRVSAGTGVALLSADGSALQLPSPGYRHF